MLPLIEFPELVQHYAPHFENVFSADAFIEFKRYISGLIVSENKTVDGINRLFVTESRASVFVSATSGFGHSPLSSSDRTDKRDRIE